MLRSFTGFAAKSASSMAIKTLVVVGAGLGGASLVSSSVFAALTATASNVSGGSVQTGTLSLTQANATAPASGGFTTAITALAPGDTINRYVDLTNGGSINAGAMTLGIAASPANVLTTNATTGLQITVDECSIAWSTVTAGVCSGTTTHNLLATPAATLLTAQTFTPSTLTASATALHLKIVIALPAGSEITVNGVSNAGVNTVQGLTTAVTWTFTETERTALTTNS
jgi:hypothetical protein